MFSLQFVVFFSPVQLDCNNLDSSQCVIPFYNKNWFAGKPAKNRGLTPASLFFPLVCHGFKVTNARENNSRKQQNIYLIRLNPEDIKTCFRKVLTSNMLN